MMDWTDRHCRVFHRQFSTRAILYTEMIPAAALVRGGAVYLLEYSAQERPVALQLGGSDPAVLAQAVTLAREFQYDEINLNVGCPSDRVQSGAFGAVLMRFPELVADCVAAMVDAAEDTPITVKCRIGVDEQIPAETLPRFLETVSRAGVRRFVIHARKAWLQGLSPRENRSVPPLDYPLVHAMKAAFPHLEIEINGGLETLDAAIAEIAQGLDGAMVGRSAYHAPADVLMGADRRIYGEPVSDVSPEMAVMAMLPYIEEELSKGTRLHQITRHMQGAFAGRRGARAWRRLLSEGANRPGAGPELVETALKCVTAAAAA